jgi:hypothetical protein
MNTGRIVVLTIAVGAGGLAACPASGSDNKAPRAAFIAQLPTVDVVRGDVNRSNPELSKPSASVDVARDGVVTTPTTAKWPKGRNV